MQIYKVIQQLKDYKLEKQAHGRVESQREEGANRKKGELCRIKSRKKILN